MHIEQQPREVTDKEGEDDCDEDDAETDLLLLIPPPEPGDCQVDPDVHEGDQGEREEAKDDKLRPAVIQDVVHRVCPELRGHDPDQVRVLVTPNNLSLEELGDIEKDGEDEDGEAVLHQSLDVTGDVLNDAVVVDGLVGGKEPLQRDADRGEDGSSHGDVVQGVEDDGEHDIVVGNGFLIRAELFDGVEHHGDDVDQVPGGEHGQELIEEGRPYLGPSQEKYCSNISQCP